MLMNNHIIEEFSWVTAPLHNYEGSHVVKATINDFENKGEMEQDFYGVMPNYFDTTIKEFTDEFHGYENFDQYYQGVPFTSELSLSEQLYTPRGSQGTLTMAYAW